MHRSCMIRGYRNLPGNHCGSTAMRNLLFHYCGLELSEGEVFGLGSGIDFVLLESGLYEPNVMLFGRGMRMESDVAEALGVDYRETIETDNATAWEVVREEVLAGRPTMLSGDALYLDYRDFKVHFPAHRFVLLGFDDDRQIACVADRIVPETQECSYEALAKSRNPPDFISTFNLWGKFHATEVAQPLEDAMRVALARAAARMVGDGARGATSDGAHDGAGSAASGGAGTAPMDEPIAPGNAFTQTCGIAGIEEVVRRLPDWSVREDFPRLARYAAACIESFGTGGGNFRNLYAAFLDSAHRRLPDVVDSDAVEVMRRSAAAWTILSRELATAGLAERTDRPPLISAAQATARGIAELERQIFEKLSLRAA